MHRASYSVGCRQSRISLFWRTSEEKPFDGRYFFSVLRSFLVPDRQERRVDRRENRTIVSMETTPAGNVLLFCFVAPSFKWLQSGSNRRRVYMFRQPYSIQNRTTNIQHKKAITLLRCIWTKLSLLISTLHPC